MLLEINGIARAPLATVFQKTCEFLDGAVVFPNERESTSGNQLASQGASLVSRVGEFGSELYHRGVSQGEDQPREPIAEPPPFPDEARGVGVWREWLASMARDPEAALAAAIAYRDLDDKGRERWLSTVEQDARELSIPSVALFGPLLGVENDSARRAWLLEQIGNDTPSMPRGVHQALCGNTAGGIRVIVLVLPLYLDFVQLLSLGVVQGCFAWVRHDPIALVGKAPRHGEFVDGAKLEQAPLKSALDEVAVAILGHRRSGSELPEPLHALVDLLGSVGP